MAQNFGLTQLDPGEVFTGSDLSQLQEIPHNPNLPDVAPNQKGWREFVLYGETVKFKEI